MRALSVDDRLDAIAGPPAGLRTAPGSVALAGFEASGPRILYCVYDATASTDSSYALIAGLRDDTTNVGFWMQSTPAGAWSVGFKQTTADIGAGFSASPRLIIAASPAGAYVTRVAAAYSVLHNAYQRSAIMGKLLQMSGGGLRRALRSLARRVGWAA